MIIIGNLLKKYEEITIACFPFDPRTYNKNLSKGILLRDNFGKINKTIELVITNLKLLRNAFWVILIFLSTRFPFIF